MQNNAGFFVRLFAYIIDCIILFFATLGIRIIGLFYGGYIFTTKVFFNVSLFDVFAVLISSLYFVLLTFFTGQTIGKMLLKIKVINDNLSKNNLGIFQIIIRETFAKYLSRFILYMGFFMIGIDKNKRGLHDLICDTKVVYIEE